MKLSATFSWALVILSTARHVSALVPRQGSQRQGGGQGGNAKNGGGQGGNTGGDPQTSLTLDPDVIATGFANDGQDVPADGQVPSLTSSNNFINFCLTVPDLPITNGKQITTGSCNPAPIGAIPSAERMPSSKFTNPQNGATIESDTQFTITMGIKNLQTGAFVNAQQNYFAAPQQLNNQGTIIGHSHVVIEELQSLDQTKPTNPKKFAFFKGLNGAAVGGVLSADVTAGVPPGAYRLCSINSAANHQPVIAPVAQHGSLDDCVYFTAAVGGAQNAGDINLGGDGGNTGDPNTGDNGGTASSSSAAAGATSTPARGGSGRGKSRGSGGRGR